MEIVLANKNVHVIREYRSLFKEFPQTELYTIHDFPEYISENHQFSSFEEGARLLAAHAAQSLNQIVIADCAGLVVPALGGRPGVSSSTFAGRDATDKENCDLLLKEMDTLKGIARSAYYECSVACCTPEGVIHCVTARCEGEIALKEHGSSGFSYDPLFRKHDYEKTFGEMDESVKNRISHRRKAFEKMRLYLESLPRLHAEKVGEW